MFVALCPAAQAADEAGGARRPNVLVVLADDLGYGDISCYNQGGFIPTPNHDRLASQGMLFTDAHSNSAVCSPTRYGLLTGRYAWRTRLQRGVLGGYAVPLIDEGRTTIGSLLHDQGYATAAVGKWHLGVGWRGSDGEVLGNRAGPNTVDWDQPLASGPHTLGFDYSLIVPRSFEGGPYCYIENGVVVDAPTGRMEPSPYPASWREGPASPGFDQRSGLVELTRRCEQWIVDQHANAPDQPWMLYFAMTSPHSPVVPRPPFVGSTPVGAYGDFVVEHDWSLGQLLDTLERTGQIDDTLVIVTSDNGPARREAESEDGAQIHVSSGDFRGRKSDIWEGGHRVPFIVRWPGVVEPGSTSDETICLTDLLATLADVTGVTLPDDAGEDSVSILPALKGESPETPLREATVLHSLGGVFAIREGRWKLILSGGSGGWTMPDDQIPAGAPDVQLYDLDADPAEETNVSAEHSDVVERLRDLLETYRTSNRSTPVE